MLLSGLFCLGFVSEKPLTVALLIYRCSESFALLLNYGRAKTVYWGGRELSLSISTYFFLSRRMEVMGECVIFS